MSGALMPLAMMMGKRAAQMGFNAVRRRRSRRTRNNQWVLGSRLLGLPFAPSSTPRARLRARRNRRRRAGNGMVNTTVQQPATFGNVVRQPVAPASRTESGNEDLDVVSSITSGSDPNQFWTESYSINPVESDTFARLAVVASQYQRYTFRRLQLVYTPFKGTSQAGELMLGFASDPTTPDPTNETEFMGLYGAVRAPVNLPATFDVNPLMFSKALNQYMLRMNATPAASDDNVINSVGRFYWATQNVGTLGLPLGRLSISYVLDLVDPKIKPEGAAVSSSVAFDGSSSVGESWLDDILAQSPPGAVYPEGDGWRTRLRFRSLLIVRGVALTPSIVKVNGVTADAVDLCHDTAITNRWLATYVLPARARFQVIGAADARLITVTPLSHDLTAIADES